MSLTIDQRLLAICSEEAAVSWTATRDTFQRPGSGRELAPQTAGFVTMGDRPVAEVNARRVGLLQTDAVVVARHTAVEFIRARLVGTGIGLESISTVAGDGRVVIGRSRPPAWFARSRRPQSCSPRSQDRRRRRWERGPKLVSGIRVVRRIRVVWDRTGVRLPLFGPNVDPPAGGLERGEAVCLRVSPEESPESAAAPQGRLLSGVGVMFDPRRCPDAVRTVAAAAPGSAATCRTRYSHRHIRRRSAGPASSRSRIRPR